MPATIASSARFRAADVRLAGRTADRIVRRTASSARTKETIGQHPRRQLYHLRPIPSRRTVEQRNAAWSDRHRRRGLAWGVADKERAELALARLPDAQSAASPQYRCLVACRDWPPDLSTSAIIANCDLVTVVLIGVAVLGEKLTPIRSLGDG